MANAQKADSLTSRFAFPSDTTLKSYSLEELENYRKQYDNEITRLSGERSQLLRQGIADAEMFLAQNSKSQIGDKVLMRLGELYYEREHDSFEKRMQEYDKLYTLYEKGELAEPPQEPRKELSTVINTYRQVINKYPQSDLIDDSYYNIAFSFEEIFKADSARIYYLRIIDEFDKSPLLADVYMRLGENYFNPPANDIRTAIGYYEKVLSYYDSPRYDEALYRLGWGHYRLKEYSKAISYFTLLADDIYRIKPFDPLQKYSNPSLVDESIEYIGLSFLEQGGPDAAVRYLQGIGGRDYGIHILKRLGDAYMDEKENYSLAFSAYQQLLKLYPFSPIAPAIQNRIVQAYRRMENSVMAFYAREVLFDNYKVNSAWWSKNSDKNSRQQAYILTESALRDNISVLLNKGQETGQTDLFEQSVSESRKYLSTFPSDSSAPLIHWNMALMLDTKLKRMDEAYDEYIKMSNLYWDTRYQRFAAENAVALAREAALNAIMTAEEQAATQRKITLNELRSKAAQQKDFNFREHLLLPPIELSSLEKRLAQAYDNYIMLFPHAKETPLFLANNGVLYYRRNQFKEALKYFNTLVKYFPDSEEIDQARYAIMESYFGRGDFQSSEIMARRILHGEVDQDLKLKARRRLAESVFLNAEILSQQNLHMQAGNEYRRVVKENSSALFADLALFNAALEYDKAGDFIRAMETYQKLVDSYSNSAHIFDALNNLAFDYAELGEYGNAASTYERLSDIHSDPLKSRDALYNSNLYYIKAKDWQHAINVTDQFLQKYPTDISAEEIAFELPSFYRQLGDLNNMMNAYDRFIKSYPHSPRTIEAFYRKAEQYNRVNQGKAADVELEKAILKGNELGKLGYDKNEFFSAEAEFALALTKLKEFDSISFRLSESDLNKSKERKKSLLLELISHLSNAASYGTVRLYEATFMIGLVHQNFAATWAAQEIPKMDETRTIVAQKEINDAAIKLYDGAIHAHKNTIIALHKLADGYRDNLLRKIQSDSLQLDSLQMVQSIGQDTVLQDINNYIEKAKLNLSLINYEKGDLSYKTCLSFVNAPIPKGLGPFPELIYRKQVIDVAAIPIIQEAATYLNQGLVQADSFAIQSQWTQLSMQKLMMSKNLVPDQYCAISQDGFNLLGVKFREYNELLHHSTKDEKLLKELQARYDEIANLVEFNQKCVQGAIEYYKTSLQYAIDSKFENLFIVNAKDSLTIKVLLFAARSDSLSREAKRWANAIRDQFLISQDPIFEEGLFAFDNIYLTLRDVERSILLGGYNAAKSHLLTQEGDRNILMQLTRLDPERYASELGLQLQETILSSDTTWLTSSTYVEGWASPEFNDTLWIPVKCFSSTSTDSGCFIWPVVNQTTKEDSVSQKPSPIAASLFFRKSVNLNGLPVSCKIVVQTQNSFNLFFNGDHIDRKIDNHHESMKVSYDVSDFLVSGNNLIAIELNDIDNNRGGLYTITTVKSIPDWEEKKLRNDMNGEKNKNDINTNDATQ
jgi:cellulose synthase operon protein C